MEGLEVSPTMKTNNENVASTSENSHKVLIDPTIPIEELLGSVTTYNNVDGSESFQLRTSARVFKKMKLDSALAALPEKKEPEKKEEIKSEIKKPFQKPFWTTEDKNYFFEALNEYGKDFEAIHTYINTKLKKKGALDIVFKSREQIRHLYYRTWHKISKHLKFSKDVKKVVQELYALINYGELRKKLTSVSEKTCIKLNELIYRGTVAIRVKGRTIRIKTPMCKALRRLNRLEENDDDIKLPTRVLVECMPKDMYTWMKVQEMSQNPRIRTLVPLQRRLSSLIYYLSQRWKSSETIEYEKWLTINECTNQTMNETLCAGKMEPRNDPSMRLTPPKDVSIVVPTFNITEFFTTQSICLNAYEERTGTKESGEALWLEAFPSFRHLIKNGSNKRGLKRTRTESNSEKGGSPNNIRAGSSLTTLTDNNENCVTDTEMTSNKVDELIDEAVNTILSLQNQEVPVPPVTLTDDKTDIPIIEDDCLVLVKRDHDISNIRLGWTLADCGTLTVGDLYLMFGIDSKIQLEYGWDDSAKLNPIKCEDVTMCEEVDVKIGVDDDTAKCDNYNCTIDQPILNNRPSVTSALKQLLSVAKLHYRKNIVKCPCGHVCGSPTKSQSKSKIIHKVSKTCSDNKNMDLQSTSTMVTVIQQSNVTTTASMVPILIQPEIKKFSPQSLFRRPTSPNCGLRAQINSIQRMMPRYCNRKGRPRTKQVVVERKLPLLANKADSGRIVQMNIISSQDVPISLPRPIAPKLLTIGNTEINSFSDNNMTSVKLLNASNPCDSYGDMDMELEHLEQQPKQPKSTITNDILDNATTLSRVSSPTSISNLLDMALQTHTNGTLNAEGRKEEGVTSFVGLLPENVGSTPPASPSRILKENDNQWINAEVADFSFSSFLGHLDSPIKTMQTTNMVVTSEDTRMSLTHDMDAHLQSLLTESSMDYTAKFADLAAQVSDCKK